MKHLTLIILAGTTLGACSQSYGHGQAYNPYSPQARQAGTYAQPYGQRPAPVREAYSYIDVGAVAYDPFDETYGVQLRGGYQSANYWGVEGEGSIGVTERTESVVGVPVDISANYSLAGFARGALPVTDNLNLLARLGYHSTEVEVETLGTSTDIGIDGVAYGVGLEFDLGISGALRLDYTNYEGSEDDEFGDLVDEVDSLAASYQVRF